MAAGEPTSRLFAPRGHDRQVLSRLVSEILESGQGREARHDAGAAIEISATVNRIQMGTGHDDRLVAVGSRQGDVEIARQIPKSASNQRLPLPSPLGAFNMRG